MSSSPIPRLRVLAGPSPFQLTDISELVNTSQPHAIESSRFTGRVVIHVKGFPGAQESEYFDREDRRGITWSIQMQGRFLHPYSSDDVLFGNTFDRPLKLPWGSGAALKFMHFIDPTLEHDLAGPKPWALSPLIATMPHFAHTELSEEEACLTPLPLEFPPAAPSSIKDDIALLCQRVGCDAAETNGNGHTNASTNGSVIGGPRLDKASKRRTYFSEAKNRRQIIFGPEDVLTTDFCYGFLSFPTLALNLPGGISFDLKKYWDGQPVRFVCVERGRKQEETEDDGDMDEEDRTFWCIVIEADED